MSDPEPVVPSTVRRTSQPRQHLAHRRHPLAPVARRAVRAVRERQAAGKRTRDRGREPLGVGDRDTRVVDIPEPRDGRRDDRTADRLVLVELDGVEAVGERRDDVRHDEHVGVLQVADHLFPRPGAEEQGSRPLQSPGRLCAEQVRADEHERAVVTERARRRLAQADVDPVGMGRPEVQRDASGRQVGRPRRGAPVGLGVDRVRDEHDRPGRALAAHELGRADDDLSCDGEQSLLVRRGALALGGRSVGREPVVGHVVQRRPSGALGESHGSGVVDPEQRMPHPERLGRADHRRGEALVGPGVEAPRQPLRGTEGP